jgi:hypothetical protein
VLVFFLLWSFPRTPARSLARPTGRDAATSRARAAARACCALG